MIFLDSDVVIDLLREYPPAMAWFDALDDDETRACNRPSGKLQALFSLVGQSAHSANPVPPSERPLKEQVRL